MQNKFKATFCAGFLGLLAQAAQAAPTASTTPATCTYSFDKTQTEVTWTGYKTNEKVGVKGSFTDVQFTFKDKAASVKELVESVQFTVNTASIKSGDPARDENLRNFVFNLKSGIKGEKPLSTISGKVVSYDPTKKMARGELTLHDKNLSKDFQVSEDGETLNFQGSIDLASDFQMQAYVAALAKACEALHKGKTWSEVGLAVKAKYKKTC